MKLIRYQYQGREAYGVLEGESVRELVRPPFSGIQYNGEVHGLEEVQLLTPTAPKYATCWWIRRWQWSW